MNYCNILITIDTRGGGAETADRHVVSFSIIVNVSVLMPFSVEAHLITLLLLSKLLSAIRASRRCNALSGTCILYVDKRNRTKNNKLLNLNEVFNLLSSL